MIIPDPFPWEVKAPPDLGLGVWQEGERAEDLAERLAAYERRFGPLP